MSLIEIFHETDGELIDAAQAATKQNAFLAAKEEEGNLNPIRSQFFGIEKIKLLLSKSENVVGLRIAYGLDKNEPSLILVAVDKFGNNIAIDKTGLKDMPEGGDYLSNGPKCPNACGGN